MTKLERRIESFNAKVQMLQQDMVDLKARQDELIDLIRQVYSDKKTRR